MAMTGRKGKAKNARASASPTIAQRTRQQHAGELAQDYAEMIAELIAETGEARVSDLARRLGVTHVTVAKTIQRLARAGLVTSLPYRAIFLTDAGKKLAQESRERHLIVLAFLKSLGVPADVAEADSEGIEHHVSKQTLGAMKKWLGKQA